MRDEEHLLAAIEDLRIRARLDSREKARWCVRYGWALLGWAASAVLLWLLAADGVRRIWSLLARKL